VSDFDSEIFDRALAEIVGDTPAPPSAHRGWGLRSRTPLIELDDLSPDWWAARARLRSARTCVRSPRAAQRRHRPASSVSRVELNPKARAAIRRELARDWDGREQGGALVGRIVGETVLLEDAGGLGLGVGVPTARGDSWFRAAAPTPRGRLPRGLPPLLVLSLKHHACPADALRGGWDVRVRSRKRQRRRPETASFGTVRDPTCGPFHFVRLASLLPGGGKRSTCGG
jgi:hypothetical protein